MKLKHTKKQEYSTTCQKCAELAGGYCDNPKHCKLLKIELNRTPGFPYIEPNNYNYEQGIK